MREMVDRVKRGEPLYGHTDLTDYMQGVAARNSRYTGVFLHVVPMFNFVNHSQVGVFSIFHARFLVEERRPRGWVGMP